MEPFPATGERRRISQDLGAFPVWSADGSELFYRPLTSGLAQRQTLKRIAITTAPTFAYTSEEQLPIENYLSFAYYRSYDITPDGEQFVLVFPAEETTSSASASAQIRIIENWFTELEHLVPTD